MRFEEEKNVRESLFADAEHLTEEFFGPGDSFVGKPNGLRLVDRIADETLLVEVFLFYTPHYYAPHNPVRIPNLKSHTVPFYAKLLGAWIAMGFRNPKMEVAGTVDA